MVGSVLKKYDVLKSAQQGVIDEMQKSLVNLSVTIAKAGLAEDIKKVSDKTTDLANTLETSNPRLLKMLIRLGELAVAFPALTFLVTVNMNALKQWGTWIATAFTTVGKAIAPLLSSLTAFLASLTAFSASMLAIITGLLAYIFAPEDVGKVLHREEGLFGGMQLVS